MAKLLLILCFLSAGFIVSAQSVAVKKTTNVVVIRGVSFYLHVVDEGQTLYSICKAYGVDVEKIKELNDKKDNTLSLMEVLKIPYVEPSTSRSQSSGYHFHKVKKGETLYSISRKFNINVKRILKENEQYDGAPSLPIGALVRLPLSEIDAQAVKEDKAAETAYAEVEESTGKQEVHERKDEVESHAVQDSKSAVVTDTKTAAVEQKEEKSVAVQPVPEVKKDGVENKGDKHPSDMPDYLSGVVITDGEPVRVALLLPLYIKERSTSRLLTKAESFVYFYEGILMAVDSLKRSGMNIDLHVYDTERDAQSVIKIANELNHLKPDLIIGPVYGSTFKSLMDNLNNRNIPVVYPLSNRMENLNIYPNFVQVNTSFNTLADEMTIWIAGQSDTANIISIHWADDKQKSEEQMLLDKTEKKIFVEKTNHLKGVNFFNWNYQQDPLAALKTILKEDKENIIILPTSSEADVSKVLPALSLYAGTYRITVVGFPEWQTFTSVDHETYYKLNVKLFGYSYVDYSTDEAKLFAADYRKYFHMEPSNLASKAYDMGLYFIELANKYRDRTLEVLEYSSKEGLFSRFDFAPITDGQGKENKGLYIINYGSDYHFRLESVTLR